MSFRNLLLWFVVEFNDINWNVWSNLDNHISSLVSKRNSRRSIFLE
jgi:hypothetical protein